MSDMFEFQYPYLLLLIVPILILPFLRGGLGKSGSIRFSNTFLAGQLGSPKRSNAGRWLAALRTLALICLIVAIAKPRLGEGSSEVEASGIDIVLAVDLSGSMLAEDFTIASKRFNRLEVVKIVLKEFIDKRAGDRLALVAFAGEPYLVSPLTLNHDWLLKNLDRLELGLIKEEGTAIGSALIMSSNRLKELQAKSKIVILLTDGANNRGAIQPVTAAEAAAALDIKVYTIAAGSEGEAPFPVTDRFGTTRYEMHKTEFDKETLIKISELTDGTFFHATDTKELQNIYEQINELEKTEIKIKNYINYKEFFIWPLAAGLAIFLLEFLLGNTRLKTLP